jgi:hypothetical protein
MKSDAELITVATNYCFRSLFAVFATARLRGRDVNELENEVLTVLWVRRAGSGFVRDRTGNAVNVGPHGWAIFLGSFRYGAS